MNEDSIIHFIVDTYDGVDTITSEGTTFFFYGPDRKFPFVTLVTSDAHDQFSDLNRPSVFRLNIGIGKQTYRSLFGTPTLPSDAGDGADSGYDFTAPDQLLPHPVYGRMYWVCVLNPSAATFQAVIQPLLAEAYELAVGKYAKRAPRG
jgi:hypothetical protein